MNRKELFKTEEGSYTIYLPDMDEYYHSWFGAIAESRHVYISSGLHYMAQKQSKFSILEMGFGTGLNAILTYLESLAQVHWHVDYTTLEIDPLTMEQYQSLNYWELLQLDVANKEVFDKMHYCSWGIEHSLSDRFSFHKKQESLLEFFMEKNVYDLVYFDAFSPGVQPELWTVDVFRNIYESLKPGGVVVTYASRGTVKQALKEVGFSLERLQGSPRKHHMLRAIRV